MHLKEGINKVALYPVLSKSLESHLFSLYFTSKETHFFVIF